MKNKIFAMMLLLMISVTSVNANLCDRATEEELYEDENLIMDLDGDGSLTISDIVELSQNQDNESWCEETFGGFFRALDRSKIHYVTGTGSFSKYNLDKRNEVTMSRNIWGSVAREIQYNGHRYKVGLLWDYAWLVDKDTNEKINMPEGLEVEVKYRTPFTRFLTFSNVETV